MSVILRTFPVGPLRCTCAIVACPDTGEALVVDPGDEAPRILRELAAMGSGTRVVSIVHTHAHFDHVLAAGALREATGAPLGLHPDDRWLWDNVGMQTRLFLGQDVETSLPPPDRALAHGELLSFGACQARLIHTPGHTPGSLCLYHQDGDGNPLLLAGDTLFRRSVGRTDLWGGSSQGLVRSIRERLFTLPPATVVIPGHGPPTTLAEERLENPFVGDHATGP